MVYLAGDKKNYTDQVKGSKFKAKEGNTIKIKKSNPEVSNMNPKSGVQKLADGHDMVPPANTRILLGKRSTDKSTATAGTVTDSTRGEKLAKLRLSGGLNDDDGQSPSVSNAPPKDSKPLLRLKFKNPYYENQTSWAPPGEDDKSFVKGQRSKRKRPSPVEKTLAKEDEEEANTMDDGIMDANWILQKLGKEAIGKRVEVHQPSSNSW